MGITIKRPNWSGEPSSVFNRFACALVWGNDPDDLLSIEKELWFREIRDNFPVHDQLNFKLVYFYLFNGKTMIDLVLLEPDPSATGLWRLGVRRTLPSGGFPKNTLIVDEVEECEGVILKMLDEYRALRYNIEIRYF